MGGRTLEGKDLWDPLEMGAGEGMLQSSAAELGFRLGIGSGGAEGEVKVCSQPSCFPHRNLLTHFNIIHSLVIYFWHLDSNIMESFSFLCLFEFLNTFWVQISISFFLSK